MSSELLPGELTDILVAEALGATWKRASAHHEGVELLAFDHEGRPLPYQRSVLASRKNGEITTWVALPPYSTDRGAAWEVFEQLAARGLSLTLELSSESCTVYVDSPDPDDFPPLAVEDAEGPPSEAFPLAVARVVRNPQVLAFLQGQRDAARAS